METNINDIIHVIQLAVAAVFLLSEVGRHAAAGLVSIEDLEDSFPMES